MAEVAASHRAVSRQTSPVPRRQLGILPVNQRSYSRVGSKGMVGDESPLMSPLPYYARRRSVTFADGQNSREERPNYNTTYSVSAPVSPVRHTSPPPTSILKSHSSYPVAEAEDSAAMPAHQPPAATASGAAGRRDPARTSPTPTRARSNSRQRLAARRREAQLHHSFYDDSVVEDFVQTAKAELEAKEAEQLRAQEQLRVEQERAKAAERRVSEATDKISALERAKQVLSAAAVQRHASVTPSPPRAPVTRVKRNSSLLRELESDPDPEVQAALKELARNSLAKQQSRVQAPPRQRGRSMPIVSADALDESDGDDGSSRKRARLEKIVSRLLAKKAKSRSTRSVMVIDWSDIDSEASSGGSEAEEEEEEEEERAAEAPVASTVHRRGGSRHAKSRSVATAAEATLVPSSKAAQTASVKRAASSKRRHISVEPALGDSLLFEEEEERPLLLPRRRHTRPAPTRSISHIAMDDDDDVAADASSMERAVRRPPRATRAPAMRQRRGQPTQEPPRGGGETSSAFTGATASRATPAAATAGAAAAAAAAPPRPRRATAPRADPNDPMAVFFEAAFPSPSKFDAMMMQAGGLPETRRGQRHQPNLVLPSSIGRRR
ncbi:hypothetical protein NESM_000247400 [Novymonas esmeraldas]|uniref:Uncharacterized protein n=1 Tax=Novymonas esmeraldas TaxID=1808958 RepID=A0AAW0F6C0_9TRYP